ncbi:MAG: hypothetical protein AAF667_16625 [Pseudomonadota bacterium]
MIESKPNLVTLALLGGLLSFAGLQITAIFLAGGVFEYPLDDVYIHLAMASELARGGYGVNSGEYASAASSALYPLLLTPFPDTEFQRFLPLFWNLAGLVLSCWIWGRILVLAGIDGFVGAALAFIGPLLVGAHSTAYTGMEHALHAAASLAIIYGLAVFLLEKRITPFLLLGAIFSPVLRFEGLALALLAVGVLFISGRRVVGLSLGLAVVLPIAAFCAWLVSLGLDPLPNSVQAKLTSNADLEFNRMQRMLGSFWINIGKPGGLALLCMVLGAVLMRSLVPSLRSSPAGMLVLVAVGAGLGHLFLGQIGWMERYEHYALFALGAALIVLAGQAAGGRERLIALTVACTPFAISGSKYVYMTATEYPFNVRAIHFQQGQMARYAQGYADVNVAVNDLGRVVWGNPNYVLDLWGLANDGARRIRIFSPELGWAGPLVTENDVRLVMIYDTDAWLGGAVDPSWIRLGVFQMRWPRGFLGGAEVAVYAARAEDADYLVQRMRDFQPTMPEDTRFFFEPAFR